MQSWTTQRTSPGCRYPLVWEAGLQLAGRSTVCPLALISSKTGTGSSLDAPVRRSVWGGQGTAAACHRAGADRDRRSAARARGGVQIVAALALEVIGAQAAAVELAAGDEILHDHVLGTVTPHRLAAPLVHAGKPVGTLSVYADHPQAFTAADSETLDTAGGRGRRSSGARDGAGATEPAHLGRRAHRPRQPSRLRAPDRARVRPAAARRWPAHARPGRSRRRPERRRASYRGRRAAALDAVDRRRLQGRRGSVRADPAWLPTGSPGKR